MEFPVHGDILDYCLNFDISVKGSQIRPDPLANKNKERRAFCNLFDGYGSFCESTFLFLPIY